MRRSEVDERDASLAPGGLEVFRERYRRRVSGTWRSLRRLGMTSQGWTVARVPVPGVMASARGPSGHGGAGHGATRLIRFFHLAVLDPVPVQNPVAGAVADAEPLGGLIDRQTLPPDDGAPLPVHLPAFPGHGPGQPAAVSYHPGCGGVRLLWGHVMRGSQQVEEFSAVQARDVAAVPVLPAGQGSAALGAGTEFPGRLFWFQVVSPGICILPVRVGGSGHCSTEAGWTMAPRVRDAAMRDGASPAHWPRTPEGRDGVVGTAVGRKCDQVAMTAVSPERTGPVNTRRVLSLPGLMRC